MQIEKKENARTDEFMDEISTENEEIAAAVSEEVYPEEETTAEQLRDEISKNREVFEKVFEKRRVHPATKEERKELYKSEHVYTERDSKAPVMTTAMQKRKEYEILMQASRSVPKPRILKGTIVGMKETNAFGICAVANLEHSKGFYDILIPIKMLVHRTSLSDIQKERLETIKIIQNRICSDIKFVVYDVIETEGSAVGSRIHAMSLEGIDNYVKELEDGLPRIFPGKIVQGYVTETRKNGLFVESHGAECFIKAAECSHNAVREVNEEYEVGQSVFMKIMEVGTKEVVYGKKKAKIVTIIGSMKEAEDDPKEIWFDKFNIGDISQGEVKLKYEKGVLVNLQGKMDCMCFYPNYNNELMRGQQVVVRIIEKKDAEKRISGMIVRVLDFV